MTQRLSRARTALRQAGARFGMPSQRDLPTRVAAVIDVCHLVFTEGYARTSGEALLDVQLAEEAIRLVRQLHAALPEHAEVAGALALMLLTHARSPARVDTSGDLVPLAEQDRSLWRRDLITEGVELLERTLPRGHVGRFQLQAANRRAHRRARRPRMKPSYARAVGYVREVGIQVLVVSWERPGPTWGESSRGR